MAQVSRKQAQILVEYFRDTPKILILEGAVRSGKTYLNNLLFYCHVKANAGKNLNYIITGHTVGSVARNVLAPMVEMFGIDTKTDPQGMFHMFGNKVYTFGSDKADSYRNVTGFSSSGWLGNEISLSHSNTVQECFNRISDEGSFALWDSNPSYPMHPVKLNYIDRSGEKLPNGRTWIRSYNFQLRDNAFLDSEYVQNLVRSTPQGQWYDRYVLGKWTAAEGLVYDLFRPSIHVVDMPELPRHWEHFRSVDFGYANPFCCLWGARDSSGRIFIYREYYQPRRLIADHIAYILSQDDDRAAWTTADHDAQGRAELQAAGIPTTSANKQVELGIQRVAQRLVVDEDGYPRLFIDASCKNLIREFMQYQWNPSIDGKPEREEPLKLHDHALDALRYAVMRVDRGKVGLSEVSMADLGLA